MKTESILVTTTCHRAPVVHRKGATPRLWAQHKVMFARLPPKAHQAAQIKEAVESLCETSKVNSVNTLVPRARPMLVPRQFRFAFGCEPRRFVDPSKRGHRIDVNPTGPI